MLSLTDLPFTLPTIPQLSSNHILTVGLILFAFLSFGVAQARSIIGQRQSNQSMTYVVKWGREKLRFSLPPPDCKLSTIRKEIAEYTQLPPDNFKLVHAGAVMKDDNAPISAYGIHANSVIAVIGGPEDAAFLGRPSKESSSKKPPPERRTEASTITQIHEELERVRAQLAPGVDVFLAALAPSLPAPATVDASAAAPASGNVPWKAPTGEQAQEHVRLGELLLQALLRLDAIIAEGEWADARKERKGAVREVQGLLDRLDGAWQQAKAGS